MPKPFAFHHPDDALAALAQCLAVVGIESSVQRLTGRVTAVDILADRDSPAADVSAMDGYAIRISDLALEKSLPVLGESAPGAPPPEMPEVGVIRVFTGAIVPKLCDAVIKREDTIESEASIVLTPAARQTARGDHIRRAGENARQGSTVVPRGTHITAAVAATMANFGSLCSHVFARLRVAIITTGDEVGSFEQVPPAPWQLRNSNQVALMSLLSQHAWIDTCSTIHCRDDRDALTETLQEQLKQHDAVLITGGVSMGDYDYVPAVVEQLGGKILFHGLPIRPGKPILGAATQEGKLILGLPGNPVSATVGCQRFAIPLLARISGQSDWLPARPQVKLEAGSPQTLPLYAMRLVRLIAPGIAELVPSQGSGDLVALGRSHGFVEIPPHASGEGPWPYQSW